MRIVPSFVKRILHLSVWLVIAGFNTALFCQESPSMEETANFLESKVTGAQFVSEGGLFVRRIFRSSYSLVVAGGEVRLKEEIKSDSVRLDDSTTHVTIHTSSFKLKDVAINKAKVDKQTDKSGEVGYVMSLQMITGKKVSVHIKATEPEPSEKDEDGKAISIAFRDEDDAKSVMRAFLHAATLAGAGKELFSE